MQEPHASLSTKQAGRSRPRARAARLLLTLAIVGVAAPIAVPASRAGAVVTPPPGWLTEFPASGDSASLASSVIGPDANMWFVESTANKIASVTNDGTITEHPITTPSSQTHGIALGADGNLWFAESGPSQIGRMTPDGTVTEYTVPTAFSTPFGIAAGPDGNLWFTEGSADKIGRITTDGTFTEYAIPGGLNAGGSSLSPTKIIAGGDGKLWFTEQAGHQAAITSITTSGVFTRYPLSDDNVSPYAITNGPDGNIWFSEEYGNAIGRITPDGTITEYALPAGPQYVFSITGGPDGNVWFTVYGGLIGRITPNGTITEYQLSGASSGSPSGISTGPTGQIWWAQTDSIVRATLSAVIANAGGNQQAHTGTAFETNLGACVTDIDGHAVSTNVTFTAPASGASGRFPDGTTTATVATDGSGCVAAPTFTANGTGGDYLVTATAESPSSDATFALTNVAKITVVRGDPAIPFYRDDIGTALVPSPRAKVTDDEVGLVQGATVTFTAPSSGASGTFANGTTVATAVTGVNGIATAPTYTANATIGQYYITVTTPGGSAPASLMMFNDPPASRLPTHDFGAFGSGRTVQQITTGPDGAMWFTVDGAALIGRITIDGTTTHFDLPSRSDGIVTGPDGALWLTQPDGNAIVRLTTDGGVTAYPLPTANAFPELITAGADGALWFTEARANQIARITTDGAITEYAIPTANAARGTLTAGPDGAIWFTEGERNQIGRITTDGTVTEFPVPTAGAIAGGITTGPDGNLWFTEIMGNKIGRITPAGAITEFPLVTPFATPFMITTGPDGNLWFAEFYGNRLGRMTTSGDFTEFYAPSGLVMPYGITTGADNNMWFTEGATNAIGTMSITPALTATGGDAQSAPSDNPFDTALTTHVVDTDGNPMAGVTVTFTAPDSTASGTFATGGDAQSIGTSSVGSGTAVVTTDANGDATSPAFSANSVAGDFDVTAKATGFPSTATFSLTNTAVPDNGAGGNTDPPNNGGSSSSAAATPAESTVSGTLPFTGAPVLQLMMLGVLLLGAGLGATAATRRRRRPIV